MRLSLRKGAISLLYLPTHILFISFSQLFPSILSLVSPFDLTFESNPIPFLNVFENRANNAIVFAEGGYIRRASSHPTTDAITDFNPTFDPNSNSNLNWPVFAGLAESGTTLANLTTLRWV